MSWPKGIDNAINMPYQGVFTRKLSELIYIFNTKYLNYSVSLILFRCFRCISTLKLKKISMKSVRMLALVIVGYRIFPNLLCSETPLCMVVKRTVCTHSILCVCVYVCVCVCVYIYIRTKYRSEEHKILDYIICLCY